MFFNSKRHKFLIQDTIYTQKLHLVTVFINCFKFLILFYVIFELMHMVKIGQAWQREVTLWCKGNIY